MLPLQCQSITFSYGPRPTLRDVDFEVRSGSLTCIIGPNGAGKTTLLRVMTGFLTPHRGQILLGGLPLSTLSRRECARHIALVPQIEHVVFALRLREFVALGRTPHLSELGRLTDADHARIDLALEEAGVTHLQDRPITELSGGEQHRALIARALAQDTPILLLDEPNAHLDIRHQLELFVLLRRLSREQGRTVVCVTHDLNLAAGFSDETALLTGGRVVAQGPASEVCGEDSLRRHFGVETRIHPQQDGRLLIQYLSPLSTPRLDDL